MYLFFILFFAILIDPQISNTIIILVSDYFYTFRYCWYYTLGNLTIMINNYFIFLHHMIELLTKYPNNLICCITSIFLLYIVYLIIKTILR